MLTVYEKGSKKIGKEPITDFDDFFDSHVNEIAVDDTVKRIITQIDEAEFIGNNQIKNRFNDPTDIRKLSTGAKAVICVYTYPRVVFDLTDYDGNTISCVFTLPRGRVIVEMSEHGKPYDETDYPNKVRVITWAGTRICESVFRVYHYLSWCRVNQPEESIYLFEYECGRHALELDYELGEYTYISYGYYENEQLTRKLRRKELLKLDRTQYAGYNSDLPGYMCGGTGEKDYSKLKRQIKRRYEKEVSRRKRAREGFIGNKF